MSDNNFICKDCKKDFFVGTYKKVYRDGKVVLDRDYECSHCGSTNTEQKPRPKVDYSKGIPGYGKFSSASDEEKKRILQKRADEHYRKHGKEQKREFFKRAMRKSREE